VRAVFLDESDVLWIGTVSGIQKLNTRTGEIRGVTPDDPRLASWTTRIHKSRGELWVANSLGLHVLREQRWLTLTNCNLGGDSVEFIERDSSGKVWIGGARIPLRLVDGDKFLHLGPHWPFVKSSHCMREDREGNLWFGTPLRWGRAFSLITSRHTARAMDSCTMTPGQSAKPMTAQPGLVR
jgi:ligand-binding sensor domain-containing protein